MAKVHHSSPRHRPIPKARRPARLSLNRMDVTRGEYNRIIDTLNQRNKTVNDLRDGVNGLQQASDIQFKRIAQIQAELDGIKGAWERVKTVT